MSYLLLVDDDVEFAEAVSTALRNEGHEVAVEHDPQSALARLGEHIPDAIVLDVMFPENPSAGFELARDIHRDHGDVPILMLTGVNEQFPLGFSQRDIDPTWLPVTDFLEKPASLEVLCRKVKDMVR